MLGDNIKNLRKMKGFTQEELAIRVNVVRQTVSKWEKGLSVPDADTLQKLADVLETDVSKLLGGDIELEKNTNEVAEQLARINEQLVIKNRRSRRIWKTIGIVLAVMVGLYILIVAVGYFLFAFNVDSSGPMEIETTVEEKVVEEKVIEEP